MKKIIILVSVCLGSYLMLLMSCMKSEGDSSELASVVLPKPEGNGADKIVAAILQARGKDAANYKSSERVEYKSTSEDKNTTLDLETSKFPWTLTLKYFCDESINPCYEGDRDITTGDIQDGTVDVTITVKKTDSAPSGLPNTREVKSETVAKTTVKGVITNSAIDEISKSCEFKSSEGGFGKVYNCKQNQFDKVLKDKYKCKELEGSDPALCTNIKKWGGDLSISENRVSYCGNGSIQRYTCN